MLTFLAYQHALGNLLSEQQKEVTERDGCCWPAIRTRTLFICCGVFGYRTNPLTKSQNMLTFLAYQHALGNLLSEQQKEVTERDVCCWPAIRTRTLFICCGVFGYRTNPLTKSQNRLTFLAYQHALGNLLSEQQKEVTERDVCCWPAIRTRTLFICCGVFGYRTNPLTKSRNMLTFLAYQYALGNLLSEQQKEVTERDVCCWPAIRTRTLFICCGVFGYRTKLLTKSQSMLTFLAYQHALGNLLSEQQKEVTERDVYCWPAIRSLRDACCLQIHDHPFQDVLHVHSFHSSKNLVMHKKNTFPLGPPNLHNSASYHRT